MQTIRIRLPKPLDWQAQVIAEARRFNVVAIGRRAGKTALGIDRCADPAVLAFPVGWFSPSYKDMLEVWREVAQRFGPIIQRANAADKRMEFVSGGVLEFWSMDNPQAGRGRKYRRVIMDEAAFVPKLMETWSFAIRPTLSDLVGDAYFFSTPKGRNGFYQLFQWAQDMDDWRAWQMPSSVNPTIPASELAEMSQHYPERVYAQEILAQFLDDAGGVFRRVMDAATAVQQDKAQPGHTYIFGVDWARQNDWTVITVLDVTESAVVYVDRFNQVDYMIQLGRLLALAERFNPAAIIAESNAMGQPLIDQLQRTDLPVTPFLTTNATKAAAVDALALAFERGELRIPNDPVLIGELQAYEMEHLPSGLIRYSAPEGLHDDCVVSLALAWQGAGHTGPLLLWG